MPAGKIFKATGTKKQSYGGGVSKPIRKYVKRQIDQKKETMEKISFNAGSALSYDNPTIVDLTALSQDVSEDGRVGEYVRLKAIRFKGYVVRGANDAYARICIVQWRQDSTTDSLALADVFYQGSSVTNAYWQAPRPETLAGKGSFKMLYDKRVPLLSANNKTVSMISKTIYKNLTSRVTFADNATTGQNHVFLLAFSNVTDASGNEPNLFYDITVDYKD